MPLWGCLIGILSTVNCSIDAHVVGEEPDVWADVLTYIIYEEKKQDRAPKKWIFLNPF